MRRAQELWARRHVRGEVASHTLPATVVFVGGKLVTLEVEGERHTFRFDTQRFDRSLPVSLSGWYQTAAGTRRALTLTNGPRTWSFDFAGQVVSGDP
jgi:hypothetical protein